MPMQWKEGLSSAPGCLRVAPFGTADKTNIHAERQVTGQGKGNWAQEEHARFQGLMEFLIESGAVEYEAHAAAGRSPSRAQAAR